MILDALSWLYYSLSMTNAPAADRYTIAAVIIFNNDEDRRYDLGTAPSRTKAKRTGYLDGARHYPLRSSAIFELEIRDTVTGERVRAAGAETEAYKRALQIPTVGELGYW